MVRFLIALVLGLHGLVHLWYVTLSLRLVPFEPEMGWTGRSWLVSAVLDETPTRTLAAVLFASVAAAFLVGGIGFVAHASWWRPVLGVSAVASSVVLLLFWDGDPQMLVQKGLLGLIINAGILVALLARAS